MGNNLSIEKKIKKKNTLKKQKAKCKQKKQIKKLKLLIDEQKFEIEKN